MTQRSYAGGAATLTLNGSIAASGVTTVNTTGTATGWPVGATGKFLGVIDKGLASEEKILFTSRTGNTLAIASDADRGADGTSAQTHANGALIQHVIGAIDVAEPNTHINVTTGDDHTQYLKTDGTRAPTGVTAIAAVPGASAPNDSASKGTGPTLATSDHRHSRETTAQLQALLIPAGTIWPTGAAAAATGWLICDGTEVLGATYPALATEFGTGAGSRFGAAAAGNIKLPDLRQRFPMGKAASGTGSTLGGSGGSKDAIAVTHAHNHAHTDSVGGNSVGHDHNAIQIFGTSDSAHTHYIGGPAGEGSTAPQNFGGGTGRAGSTWGPSTDNGGPAHNHVVTINADATSAGSSGTDANLPGYQVINYMVKAH